MNDAPIILARLRAGGPAVLGDLERLDAPARLAGRRVVALRPEADGNWGTLGWPDDADVAPETWPITRRTLPASTLLSLAACLGCCWPDPATDPYPGQEVRTSVVLKTLRAYGLDQRWAKSSLFHDLPTLGHVEHRGDRLRLGPSIATLPRAEIALLRRAHASLPRPSEEQT